MVRDIADHVREKGPGVVIDGSCQPRGWGGRWRVVGGVRFFSRGGTSKKVLIKRYLR